MIAQDGFVVHTRDGTPEVEQPHEEPVRIKGITDPRLSGHVRPEGLKSVDEPRRAV